MDEPRIQEGETEVTRKAIQLLNSKGISFEKLEHAVVTTSNEASGARGSKLSRDASADPKEKSFFEILSKMERQHYLSLKDTEDYFTDPEGWFRKKEHHGVDGA